MAFSRIEIKLEMMDKRIEGGRGGVPQPSDTEEVEKVIEIQTCANVIKFDEKLSDREYRNRTVSQLNF